MGVSDVIPKEGPGSENAAPLYQAAVLTLQGETSGETDLFEHLADLGQKIIYDTPSAEEAATFRSLVDQQAVQECLGLVGRAATRDRCRYPLDYSRGVAILLPHVGDLRNLSRIICAVARIEADAGNAEGAWKHALTTLRLADALRDEPLLISQLVRTAQLGMAIDTVQYICRISAPSGPKIEELRDALQRCDDIGPLVSAMDGERLLFGDWFFRRASSGMTDEDAESLGIPPWLFWLGPAVRADHAEYLDIMRQYADWASRPYAAEDEGIGDRLVDQVPFYCIQTRLIVPSLSGAKTAYLRMIAHTRITRAGLAVIGAAGDDGSCPKTLAEAGIDAPIDPFTGKPLVYRAEGKGFVLYSTGKDRVDDGGTVSEDVNEAGKDIVWRFSGTGRSLSDG